MRSILLINPNTSVATTEMMLAVARPLLPPDITLRGLTAAEGARMIVEDSALAVSIGQVVQMAAGCRDDAVVVAAFADPGANELRRTLSVPVVGIGEASIRAAGRYGRRFGIATSTHGLRRAIEAAVDALELRQNFTGLRLTRSDPLVLAGDPAAQDDELAEATMACVEQDGAEAVVIGGGPLSATAARLRERLAIPLIEPVPAAIRAVLEALS